jgi:hypothetical protein
VVDVSNDDADDDIANVPQDDGVAPSICKLTPAENARVFKAWSGKLKPSINGVTVNGIKLLESTRWLNDEVSKWSRQACAGSPPLFLTMFY